MSTPEPTTITVQASSSSWTRSGVVLRAPLFSGQTLTVSASGSIHWSATNDPVGPEGLGAGYELVSNSGYAADGSTVDNPIYRYGLVMLLFAGDGTGDGPPPAPDASGEPNVGGVVQSAHVTMPVTTSGGGPRVYTATEINALAPSFPCEICFIRDDDKFEDNSGHDTVTITPPDPTPPRPLLSATPLLVGNIPTIRLDGAFPS